MRRRSILALGIIGTTSAVGFLASALRARHGASGDDSPTRGGHLIEATLDANRDIVLDTNAMATQNNVDRLGLNLYGATDNGSNNGLDGMIVEGCGGGRLCWAESKKLPGDGASNDAPCQKDGLPPAIEHAHRLATTTEMRTRAPALLARSNGTTEEELPLRALRVSTVLMGTRARTLVDCTFGNPVSRQLEGTFHVRLPDGASPCYLGMFQGNPPQRDVTALVPPVLRDPSVLLDRDIALASRWSIKGETVEWGTLRPAYVVAQERASQVYEQVTRRGVDPAVMEWSGGNTFTTRIFPIAPNGLKRVFFVYDQAPLEVGGQPSVTLPVPEKLPEGFRLEVAASARAYSTASMVTGERAMRLLDTGGFFTGVVTPTGKEGSFILTGKPRSRSIRAAFGTGGGIPGALVHARILPRVAPAAERKTGDAVFLLDTSLSQRTRLHASFGRLLRAILEKDATIERFQVIGFDVAARPFFQGWRKNSPDDRARTLAEVDNVWLEGATSIECALAAAEHAIPEGSHAAFFLLSDAQVTWGPEDPRELERGHPRLFSERWIGYQIGEEAVNRPLLERLTRRGGRIVSVLSAQDVDAAAIAHRTSPVRLDRVRVEGVEARDLVVAGKPTTLFPDQTIEVAFRTSDDPRRATIVLDADSGAQEFSIDAATDGDPVGARAWAELETGSLLELQDKDADEVAVALSQRFALANRAASFLILETDQDYRAFDLKTETLDLDDIARAASTRTNRRPVGAPEIGTLDAAARAFLDRISPVQLPAWPVQRRETRQGGFGRLEWGERVEPVAVYREASRRFESGRTEEAFRILTSIVEENPREPRALRLAGFVLMSWDRFDDARAVFGRTRVLRPYEPQAYLGEAFALEALGWTADAALRYELVLAGKFDPRYDQYAKAAAQRLYGRLLSRLEGEIAPEARARARALRCPLEMPKHEVHLLWNLDDTDVDLHCIDSSTREEVFYSHPTSATGGQLLWDNTTGLGPEIYTHPTAEPAEIFVNYFGTRSVSGTVPSATLVVYFRGDEAICRSAVLADQKDKVILYSGAAER
jgi:tetratricopeptide (TPR) repeat protein